MATVAKLVTASLIETRLPDVCGQCDTASLLTPEERTAFENRPSLIDPEGLWPELLPCTCYMVPEAEEDAVAELLFAPFVPEAAALADAAASSRDSSGAAASSLSSSREAK